LRQAECTRDPEVKATLERLAQRWEKMADEFEMLERKLR
jgi:hypothetical protein